MTKWDLATISGLIDQGEKYWKLYKKYPWSEMIISLYVATEQQLQRYLEQVDICEIKQVLNIKASDWPFINGFKKWDE
jgi:hypothetical protein